MRRSLRAVPVQLFSNDDVFTHCWIGDTVEFFDIAGLRCAGQCIGWALADHWKDGHIMIIGTRAGQERRIPLNHVVRLL